MSTAQQMLAEFDQETITTRKFLARLPDDKLEWRPHPKSMTAGQLGLHIAMAPGQVAQLTQTDVVPAPEFGRPNPQPATTAEILAAHDESAATVRKILPTFTDEQMLATWQMMVGDKPLLSMPRLQMIRAIMLNHTYHHRGQLGVYLRLMGCQVPSSYGPSGDEMPDFMQ